MCFYFIIFLLYYWCIPSFPNLSYPQHITPKRKKKRGWRTLLSEENILRVTGRSLIKVSVTQCVKRVPRLHALATYDLKREIGALDHC